VSYSTSFYITNPMVKGTLEDQRNVGQTNCRCYREINLVYEGTIYKKCGKVYSHTEIYIPGVSKNVYTL
jgi:hypothetical protein